MGWRNCRGRGWCWLVIMMAVVGCLLLYARPVESQRQPRVQRGLASYYGPGFHGEETASGETFDQREMVAAHRHLPFGTVARVTNLRNGRSVVVRIIDRGPYGRNYRKGTIIDLSKGAARRLRFLTRGIVPVRIEVLEEGNGRRRGEASRGSEAEPR